MKQKRFGFEKYLIPFFLMWFLWIAYNIMFSEVNLKSSLLNSIKDNEFSGIIIKRENGKREGTFTFIQTKNSIFKNDDSSHEFVNNSEIGDSVYKKKGVNCCLIVGKNKRLEVPYIVSRFLSDSDYIGCRAH